MLYHAHILCHRSNGEYAKGMLMKTWQKKGQWKLNIYDGIKISLGEFTRDYILLFPLKLSPKTRQCFFCYKWKANDDQDNHLGT